MFRQFTAFAIGLLVFTVNAKTVAADTNQLDQWLAKQTEITTWMADVEQIRNIKNVARPLKNSGKIWFIKPNQFRWQLGEPARTIAIRDGEQLLIVYPRLLQAERYPFDAVENPAMKQALLLLEVGFPSDNQLFLEQYELIEQKQEQGRLVFSLQPRLPAARKILQRLNLTVESSTLTMVATELQFPDGSAMRNEFSQQQYNVELPENILQESLEGYSISEPLAEQ